MLIEKEKNNQKAYKYICDRCGKKLQREERISLYIAKGIECQKKKWDLCKRCYAMLYKGLSKIKKEENIQEK